MGIKVYKPTTNGRRNMTSLDFAEITTSTPEKSLLVSLKNKAGRNNNGRITVRHQGGGHKRHYRLIDFKRNKDGVEAVVKTIEYDPNRTANIALVHYTDGVKAYIIAPKGLDVLVRLQSGEVRMVLGTCRATIGTVGNEQQSLINLGKAGRNRWKGIRPTVRGSVMNPNDHPHGGGEGKAPVGRKAPSTPWGKPALGLKTRNKKAKSDKLIVRRRNEK